MLEVAPVYLSESQAADRLAPLCDEIGEPPDRGLAARRYALTGNRRALHGTVLWSTLLTSGPTGCGRRPISADQAISRHADRCLMTA
ncbi:hypothetical protein [Streptomyces sp. NPDC021212]|uniref:hypothetical protein n=1 Tax=Streptomyces sp. NPDC021212 TaxID=3365118 RepID=UPI0037A67972